MTKFLAGVLSVIAAGVLLIAYGLLGPQASAFDMRTAVDQFGRPIVPYGAAYGSPPTPYTAVQPVSYEPAARPVRTLVTQPAERRVATERVERAPGRDWKKTALIIGGSTAGGAGLGGLIGGKKGALIGAALGGGASTIYEATKR